MSRGCVNNIPRHIDADSSSWPAALTAIDSPPRQLWLRGKYEALCNPRRIAIVGTRSPTPYGRAQAERFAAAFAEAGLTVVSGLARGIDQAAHAGALDAGGDTVAVLGSGVDCHWPRGDIADRVLDGGLFISEYPPGMEPRRHHFPMRNRLISGLCQGVLVIEAARVSGSLITCRWALDQGREVFALPGRVDQPMAGGCHRLLKEGAALVEHPREVLDELELALPPRSSNPDSNSQSDKAKKTAHHHSPHWNEQRPAKDEFPPNSSQGTLLSALRGETLAPGELAERLDRDLGEVMVDLVRLELAGSVARVPGGAYRLILAR